MHHISAGSLKSSQEWMHILPHHQCKFLTKTFYKKSGRHFKKLHILNVSMHNFRRQESFVPAIIHTPLRSSSGSSGLIYCKTFVHPPTLFLYVLVKHFSKGVFGLLTSSMHRVFTVILPLSQVQTLSGQKVNGKLKSNRQDIQRNHFFLR